VESATVSLVKPNDDMLKVTWESDDGKITADSGVTTATWKPETSGEIKVRLVASDGERRFAQELKVQVGQGSATPSPSPIESFGPTQTPTPTPTGEATETPEPGVVDLEAGLVADGDDAGSSFGGINETTSPDSTVTYIVTIDNDRDEPVTVTAVADDAAADITCDTLGGASVIGAIVGADDGDAPFGANDLDGGADEIQCAYTLKAPHDEGPVEHTITVSVEDEGGNTYKASDPVTIIVKAS
jgi:hypothetical protein